MDPTLVWSPSSADEELDDDELDALALALPVEAPPELVEL